MLADLGALHIGDCGCCGGCFQPRQRAEPVHGGDSKIIAQPPLGGGAVEHIARHRSHSGQRAEQRGQVRIGIECVGDDHFIRIDARQRGAELVRAAFGDAEFRRGNIDPGKAHAVARGGRGTRPCDGEQVVVGLGIEQRVLGQRARGHQPHHVTADYALVAALLRFGRIFRLFADRDAMAQCDQPMQVVVGPLHRHAAHRDVFAHVLAALGQRDAERT